jgi:hypothetical protein
MPAINNTPALHEISKKEMMMPKIQKRAKPTITISTTFLEY